MENQKDAPQSTAAERRRQLRAAWQVWDAVDRAKPASLSEAVELYMEFRDLKDDMDALIDLLVTDEGETP